MAGSSVLMSFWYATVIDPLAELELLLPQPASMRAAATTSATTLNFFTSLPFNIASARFE